MIFRITILNDTNLLSTINQSILFSKNLYEQISVNRRTHKINILDEDWVEEILIVAGTPKPIHCHIDKPHNHMKPKET